MRSKICILIILIFFISGCTAGTVKFSDEPEEPEQEQEQEIYGIEEVEEEIDPRMIISPLDGLRYYPEDLNKRTVAISIDNHPKARWQAGISQAEISYEFEVEFPYTRYLCIFLAKEPSQVGPVRSARPYILYYALENDSIFVHVGGSEDAFKEIKRLKAADVDGLYSGSMYRYKDTGKYAPHNMYTNLESIRKEAFSRGYREESDFEAYEFNDINLKLSDKYEYSPAYEINIEYNNYNTTGYIYDEDMSLYLRYKDKEKHIDELDKRQLCVKNIIVIETSKMVLDDEGRLFLGTIGEGKGVYFTNGECILISWEKPSEKDRLKFFNEDEEIKLNPGNTWIQIVNDLNCLNYERGQNGR